jgi:hypothetical protein
MRRAFVKIATKTCTGVHIGFWCVLLASLVGCGDDSTTTCTYNGTTYALGDTFPRGDNCNHCTCTEGGIECTKLACVDGGIDANLGACAPTGGCPDGPACGVVCCGRGERCDNGTCYCGFNPACGDGDACEAAGPIGGDACGSICCGRSGPCPQ